MMSRSFKRCETVTSTIQIQLARLLNFAADGECVCDGKEVSACFDSVVVVAEPEVEVCCDVGADALRGHQLAFEGAVCMTGMI